MGNEVEFLGQDKNEEGTAEITEVFTKFTNNQPITSVNFAPSLCLSRLSSSVLFWALSFDIAPSTPFDIATTSRSVGDGASFKLIVPEYPGQACVPA
jgi:hypothetical protein